MSLDPIATPPAAPVPLPASDLLDRTVLLVTGKGGVGKSTVAASLARLAASRGKRVLLVELESVSRAAPLFGLPGLGSEPVPVAANLSLLSLDSMASLRFFALQQLKVQTLVNLALRNRAVEGFFKAVPAIKPILFLYHLWRLEAEHGPSGDQRWDLIVCDLPTSGFVVGMFAIPRTLAQVFRVGPVAGYAEGMRQLLVDPKRSGLVLVALPEDMPVVETLELQRSLRERFGVEPAAIVLNSVVPEVVPSADLAAVAQALATPASNEDAPCDALPTPAHGPAVSAWLWAADVLAGRSRRAQGFLPRLREAAAGRVLELPFLFRRELPLDAIDHLAWRLGGQAGPPPAVAPARA